MGHPRYLKVIACVPAEFDIPVHTVEDVLQLPKIQHDIIARDRRRITDVELLHSRDPMGALAMASKVAVLTSNAAAEEFVAAGPSSSVLEIRENTTVVLGKMSTRYLLLPTVPSRSLADSLLSKGGRSAAATDVVLSIGLFAFPSSSLQQEPPLSLAVPLAASTGMIEPPSLQASARDRAAVSLESYLPAGGLRVGRQRFHEDGFVEVRSVVEYDAIIDGLFASPSFQKVLSFCSVQVVFKRVVPDRTASAERGRPTMSPVALDSLWLLAPRHAAEFAATRTTHHPLVVASCTRHYALRGAVQCGAPYISSVMITAASMRELLDQSSWVHDVVLGGSTTSSKYFPPESKDTDHDDNWLSRDTARPRADSAHVQRHVALQQEQQEAGGYLSDAADMDPSITAVVTMRHELERLGKELDQGEAAFQKSLTTRTVEANRLKQAKAQLYNLQQSLDQHRSAKEAADAQRKELAIDLSALREEVASLQRGMEVQLNQSHQTDELHLKSATSLEQRREETIARHAAEVTQVTKEWKRERHLLEQELREDERREHETIAAELSQLQQVLNAKQLEWKHRESDLTKGMSAGATSLATLDSLRTQLSTVNHRRDLLLSQLRGIISPEHATIATTGGPLLQITEAHIAMCDAEERALHDVDRAISERNDTLSALQSSVATANAEADRLTTEVSDAVAARKHEISNLQDDAVAVWWDMMTSFAQLERDHRARIEAAESSAASGWSMAESDSWLGALHAAEMRFTEEARQRCHEDVFGIATRIKQWTTQCDATRQHRDRCTERMVTTQAKHATLRDELLGHLENIRGEEHNILRFLDGKPMGSTGASFPTLEDDQHQVSTSIERLRAALATGTVVRIRGDVAKKQPRHAFAAQMAKSLHVTVDDMLQRLEALIGYAREEQSQSSDVLAGASRRLRDMEAELEDRKAILQRVVEQTASGERGLREVTSEAASASEELLARKTRHEAVRRQLQADFIAARETAMLHRAEGHTHLRKLNEEEEILTAKLITATKHLRDLEELKVELELQNPQATKDTLELRIQREVARQAELQMILDLEQATSRDAPRPPQTVPLTPHVLSLLSTPGPTPSTPHQGNESHHSTQHRGIVSPSS